MIHYHKSFLILFSPCCKAAKQPQQPQKTGTTTGTKTIRHGATFLHRQRTWAYRAASSPSSTTIRGASFAAAAATTATTRSWSSWSASRPRVQVRAVVRPVWRRAGEISQRPIPGPLRVLVGSPRTVRMTIRPAVGVFISILAWCSLRSSFRLDCDGFWVWVWA